MMMMMMLMLMMMMLLGVGNYDHNDHVMITCRHGQLWHSGHACMHMHSMMFCFRDHKHLTSGPDHVSGLSSQYFQLLRLACKPDTAFPFPGFNPAEWLC
jgi:hypothetical protein